MNRRYHHDTLLIAVLALLCPIAAVLAGCSGNATRAEAETRQSNPAPWGSRTRVVEAARKLIGVRYRYGGTTPEQGFDCSGLVYYSHGRAGIPVPRTSSQQRRASVPVSVSSLQPGDLVFFNISDKGGHVGIYAGEGRFIHAPSSGGRVRIEQIDNPYWHRRLLGGGTFLGG